MRVEPVENPATITWYAIFGLIFGGIGVVIFSDGSWLGGSIFLAIGALFLCGAIHSVVGRIRYGAVYLDLETPVVPGGKLSARLVSPGGAAGAGEINVELRCKRVAWSGAGDSQGLSETVIWSEKTRLPLLSDPAGGVTCNIGFEIPGDAAPSEGRSTNTNTAPGVYWELQVATNSVQGVDLMRGFRFPVVRA